MSQPVLNYHTNRSSNRPFSRRALLSAFFCAISITSVVLLYSCHFTWLARPSTVTLLFNLLFGSILATIITGVRLRRPALSPRGNWLAVVAVCLALSSCMATLPLLGPARESIEYNFQYANLSHFHKIYDACKTYASRSGAYPPHLAVLVADGSISPDDLLDPFSHTAPAILPSPLAPADWPKIVSLIDAHSDYVYTGSGVPIDSGPEVIILYDKPIPERGGRYILCDANNAFVQDADLAAFFATDAKARAANHLPHISPP